MGYRSYIASALLASALLIINPAPAASSGSHPNFIIILVDDLGWMDLSCQGSRYYETPNLDRLAVQGMRFTDAYAACAVCSPTRAAVMTGRYPARVGITDWIRARFQGGKIPENKKNPTEYAGGPNSPLLCPPNPLWMELEEVTIAEALKPAGYVSCHIGKWHLGADDWYPDKQGFNFNIGGCDYGQPPSYFDPYYIPKQGGIPTLKPRKEGEYLTDREADEAVQFIRKHKDKPFFLYLAHYAVHMPIQAKKDATERYQAKPATSQKNPIYAAMVQSVDDAIGQVMKALDDLKLADRTLVIFTSDNGGLDQEGNPTDNAPLRSGKGYPYEGGIRVPLIIRWPGLVQPGTVSLEPVISIDYLPTILAAAGAKLPAGRTVDGLSLVDHLKSGGKSKLDREALFWHFPHYRRPDVSPYSIVRARDWKLIKWYEGPRYELYNLKEDRSEQTDLAAHMPDRIKLLDEKLTAHLKSAGAKLPRANPDYKPGAKEE